MFFYVITCIIKSHQFGNLCYDIEKICDIGEDDVWEGGNVWEKISVGKKSHGGKVCDRREGLLFISLQLSYWGCLGGGGVGEMTGRNVWGKISVGKIYEGEKCWGKLSREGKRNVGISKINSHLLLNDSKTQLMIFLILFFFMIFL